jgi:hypothetical protein
MAEAIMTAHAIALNPKNPLTKEIEKKAAGLIVSGYSYHDAIVTVMKVDHELRRRYFTAEKIVTNGDGQFRRVRRI